MADAHGRSVIETNTVHVCVVLHICVFTLYRKRSVLKHRDLFLFHTRLIFLASWLRAETELATVVD